MATPAREDVDKIVSPKADHMERVVQLPLASATTTEVTDENTANFGYTPVLWLNLFTLFVVAGATQWATGATPASYSFLVREYPEARVSLLWVTNLPGLLVAVISLTAGQLSDHIGRRGFIITACVLGLAGSALMGWASSASQVIAGSALLSAGAGVGLLTYPFASEIVPKRDRGLLLGTFGVIEGAVATLGALLVGIFTKEEFYGLYRGWRVTMFILIGMWGISLILTVFLYHPSLKELPEGVNWKTRLRKFDWTGVALGTTGISLFLVGLNVGGRQYAWRSAPVLVLIVLGGLVIAVFGCWEWKGTATGLVPHSLFQHRNLPLSYGLAFLAGFLTLGCGGYFQLEINYLYTNDAIMSVVKSLPFAVAALAWSGFAGIWTKWQKTAGFPLGVGMVACVVAAIILICLSPSQYPYVQFCVGIILLGAQPGVLGALSPLIASISTPNSLIATSVALAQTARGIGGVVGSTVMGQVFTSQSEKYIVKGIIGKVLPLGLPVTSIEPLIIALNANDEASLSKIPGLTPVILAAAVEGLKQGAARALRYVWIATLPFTLLGVALVVALKSIKPFMTKEVIRAVRHTHHPHLHSHNDKIQVEDQNKADEEA